MIQFHFVDGIDSGAGIGIGGEQHATSIGLQGERVDQEFRAADTGHALVDQKQGDTVAAGGELSDEGHGFFGGVGSENAVIGGEFGFQVALDGGEGPRGLVN